MFFRNEHSPPHIHAIYGEYNGIIEIATLEMIEGDLPNKARALVSEWAKQYKSDLQEMWDTKQIKKLPPLN